MRNQRDSKSNLRPEIFEIYADLYTFRGYDDFVGRGRGMQVEKTGSGYERVASPYVGGHHEDQVPLNDYAQPTGYARPHHGQSVGLEPYRHS